MKKISLYSLGIIAGTMTLGGLSEMRADNLLWNSEFSFHPIEVSRTGSTTSFSNGAVPAWQSGKYGTIKVLRSERVEGFRPEVKTDAIVELSAGAYVEQMLLLSELGLEHGDEISVRVRGFQKAAGNVQAEIQWVRVDIGTGEWSPGDFGMADKRSFPAQARGDLLRETAVAVKSGEAGAFILDIPSVMIDPGTVGADAATPNATTTLGLVIRFVNTGEEVASIYAPQLNPGKVEESYVKGQALPDIYRSIPRTLQKLWRGEPLHIIIMGSSIDRGSANPPPYLYQEDPKAENFKQPLADGSFDGKLIKREDLTPYTAWWRHWFMYGGQLRNMLMQEFDYPVEKILINTMACDGSSIGEAHSGLRTWAYLEHAPEPNANGHPAGKSWEELYPELFSRPEGPVPDLVIFGSGANEKIDREDEIAVFEGAIRWFQTHFPQVEFLVAIHNREESYTSASRYMEELGLIYQFPVMNLGRSMHALSRYVPVESLTPKDGHPQAAYQFLWARELHKAFWASDPVLPGIAQQHLPMPAHPLAFAWQGEMETYLADSPRIYQKSAIIADEQVINLWSSTTDKNAKVWINGKERATSRRRSMTARDERNSSFATGQLPFGDRNIIEVTGSEAILVAADCKIPQARQVFTAGDAGWLNRPRPAEDYISAWGHPYGKQQVVLQAGESMEIRVAGDAFAVAYMDEPSGGTLSVEIDGTIQKEITANEPFKLQSGESVYLENRKGIPSLSFGIHKVKITAKTAPVRFLSLYAYQHQPPAPARVLTGFASPGQKIRVSPAPRALPIVHTSGGLNVDFAASTPEEIHFSGSSAGSFRVEIFTP